MKDSHSKNIFLAIFGVVTIIAIILILSLQRCSTDDNTSSSNSLGNVEDKNPDTTNDVKTSALVTDLPNKSIDPSEKSELEQANLNNTQLTKEEPKAPVIDEKSASGISQKFIDAVTSLDPLSAKQYVDSDHISYATIAGLCIIFEEGSYELLQDRAIRQMFLRENSAGYLVRLQQASSDSNASFALTVKRPGADTDWKIKEINLDGLLSHYSTKITGGDVHFTPLVKNPKGGESLAIYFELDSNNLTERTQKQLTIVNNLLKADPSKKLVISGHTDALGSDAYNYELSKKRAMSVVDFLVAGGLDKQQIDMLGFGKSKPRQPNTKEDGADSPEGRRVNRRAEILLDF